MNANSLEMNRSMRHQNSKPLLLGCFVLLLAGHLGIFWVNRVKVRNGYPDFAIFYAGAKILRDGLGDNLYDFELQKAYMREFSTRPIPLSFNHAPYELLLFMPFSFFPYLHGFYLWAVANVLLLFLVSTLLRPYCRSVDRLAPIVLILLCFFPIFLTILQGQDSILILLIYAVALVCLKHGHESCAGSVLSLGLFKFQLVLPFIFGGMIGKRWKMVRSFVVASALLALVSVWMVGWKGVGNYLDLLRQQNENLQEERTRVQWYIYPTQMANVRGFAAMLFLGKLPESYINIGILVCSLALTIWAGTKWSQAGPEPDEQMDLVFSLNLVVTLLVSYHMYLHDASLLILPILLVANRIFSGAGMETRLSRTFGGVILPFFLTPLCVLLMFWYEQTNLLSIPMLIFAVLVSTTMRGGRRPIAA